MSTLTNSIKNNLYEVGDAGLFLYRASYAAYDYENYHDYSAFGNFSSTLGTVVNITGSPGIFQAAIAGATCRRVVVTLDGVEYDLDKGSNAGGGQTVVVLPRLFPIAINAQLNSANIKPFFDNSPAVVFRNSLKVQVSGGAPSYAEGARVCAKVGEEWIK